MISSSLKELVPKRGDLGFQGGKIVVVVDDGIRKLCILLVEADAEG
jgi:hypothetical protein